jgi:hypothetical protein
MVQKRRWEAGIETITLTTGDGTVDVVFDNPFQFAPVIVIQLQDSDYEQTDKYTSINATSVTTIGFTIEFESASAENTVDVAWAAFERRSSDKVAQ